MLEQSTCRRLLAVRLVKLKQVGEGPKLWSCYLGPSRHSNKHWGVQLGG